MLFVVLASFVATTFAACTESSGQAVNSQCPQGFIVRENNVSCRVVATPDCADKINSITGKSDCAAMAGYCTNAAYITLMGDQCPKTCGFCITSCVDSINPTTGKSDCPGMASYCYNYNYASLMRTQCPKTCGVCTS